MTRNGRKILAGWVLFVTLRVKNPTLKENMLDLDNISSSQRRENKEEGDVLTLLKSFDYTREDLNVIIKPMAETGQEPVGSMGNDTPLAVLSKKPQLLYSYFKQLFAQVTNPAIDPIREELVMSLESCIGPQKNILEERPEHCHKLKVKNPVLSNQELDKIIQINEAGFKTKVISLLFPAGDEVGFGLNLAEICRQVCLAIEEGYTFIVLSDRRADKNHLALPALLAVGAVHRQLVEKSLRSQIGLIVESAEPREVHHFALLFGYGADCVNPYLAYRAMQLLKEEGELNLATAAALENYLQAVNKGILKILSKMGISTLQSYRGSQIFEALGLHEEVIDYCFAGTASRIGGAGWKIIEQETNYRHEQAYTDRGEPVSRLTTGGQYHRKSGWGQLLPVWPKAGPR